MRVLTAVPPAGGAVHEKWVKTLTLPRNVPHTCSLAHTFEQTYGAHRPRHSPLCVYCKFYARFSRFGPTPTNSLRLPSVSLSSKTHFPNTLPSYNISCVYLTARHRFICIHTRGHIRVHSLPYYASLHYNFTLSGFTHSLPYFFINFINYFPT